MIALPKRLASQIVKDGETGIVVTEETPLMLVTAIRYYNETPGLRQRYQVNAGSTVSDAYTGSSNSFVAQLQAAWSFEEAVPEGLHLEHTPTFFGDTSALPWWSPERIRQLPRNALKFVTNLKTRFRNK
jgi:hypothetical protein